MSPVASKSNSRMAASFTSTLAMICKSGSPTPKFPPPAPPPVLLLPPGPGMSSSKKSGLEAKFTFPVPKITPSPNGTFDPLALKEPI